MCFSIHLGRNPKITSKIKRQYANSPKKNLMLEIPLKYNGIVINNGNNEQLIKEIEFILFFN